MELALALLLKPFFLLAFFGLVVIPIEMLLAKVIPDCRLKSFLYDRTLHERRPEVFWIGVTIGYLFIIVVALLVSREIN